MLPRAQVRERPLVLVTALPGVVWRMAGSPWLNWGFVLLTAAFALGDVVDGVA
jgi:hypothetical protein